MRHGDHDGARQFESVGRLGDVVAGIDAKDMGSRSDRGELPHQRVRPVRQPNCNAVAGSDAMLGQVGAQCLDAIPERASGDGDRVLRVRVDQQRRGRVGSDLVAKEGNQGHCHAVSAFGANWRSQPSRTEAKPSTSSIG